MSLLLKKYLRLLLLVIICYPFISCNEDTNMQAEKEAIVIAYANEFINEDNEYLYFKSKKDINLFKDFVGDSITIKRIKEITKPVPGITLDSLLTVDDINSWNTQLKNYRSILWDKEELVGVPIIGDNDIPDFFYEGGIPTTNERIVNVHFLGTPIIHNNVALLIYTFKKSPMIHSSGYYMYAKINDKWKVVANDIVVWGG